MLTVDGVRARGKACVARRMRRALRRNLQGDESVLVFLDAHARLLYGWEESILRMVEEAGNRTVLTAPCAAPDGSARFPTLTGDPARRGPCRAFPTPASASSAPSVAVCYEFCAAHPDAFHAIHEWVPSGSRQADVLAQSGVRCAVPAMPLIEFDRGVDARYADDVPGIRAGTRSARVGLTEEAGERECILKFGSCRAARLTLQFEG